LVPPYSQIFGIEQVATSTNGAAFSQAALPEVNWWTAIRVVATGLLIGTPFRVAWWFCR